MEIITCFLQMVMFQSVIMAHNSVQPANIYLNSGELLESNINRSPSAYLNNPKEERDM